MTRNLPTAHEAMESAYMRIVGDAGPDGIDGEVVIQQAAVEVGRMVDLGMVQDVHRGGAS